MGAAAPRLSSTQAHRLYIWLARATLTLARQQPWLVSHAGASLPTPLHRSAPCCWSWALSTWTTQCATVRAWAADGTLSGPTCTVCHTAQPSCPLPSPPLNQCSAGDTVCLYRDLLSNAIYVDVERGPASQAAAASAAMAAALQNTAVPAAPGPAAFELLPAVTMDPYLAAAAAAAAASVLPCQVRAMLQRAVGMGEAQWLESVSRCWRH